MNEHNLYHRLLDALLAALEGQPALSRQQRRAAARRPSPQPTGGAARPLRLHLMAAALAAVGTPSGLLANPQGAQVVQGTASFKSDGKTLTVTNSNGAVINWQQFNIGAGETTRFVQPSSSSQVLNRVLGGNPSQILGSLQSNGQVFLINPSGVAFGKGAQVDVGALVISTLKLSDEDFKAGRLRFGEVGAGANGLGGSALPGKVSNEGSIRTTPGGFVYLVAPQVENSGLIHSPEGEVLLAAGHKVTLVNPRAPEVSWEVSAPAGNAINLGEVVARRIGLQGQNVKNAGLVQATTAVVGEDGRIVLKAQQRVEQTPSGRMIAQGRDALGRIKGGEIEISGTEQVSLQGRVEAVGVPAAAAVPPASMDAGVTAAGVVSRGSALSGSTGMAVAWTPDPTGSSGTATKASGPATVLDGTAIAGRTPLNSGLMQVTGAGSRLGQSSGEAAATGAPVEGIPTGAVTSGPAWAEAHGEDTAGATAQNAVASGRSLSGLPRLSGLSGPGGPRRAGDALQPTPTPSPESPLPRPDPRHALVGVASGTGGRVRIIGREVQLGEGLLIDVSGPAGGGTVLVGGELHGQRNGGFASDQPNAQQLWTDTSARIDASATGLGQGGTVILWADDTARIHGRISARGGEQGGDGGFVETSGKRVLDVTQPADAGAAKGKSGTWLLDPYNITITAAGGNLDVQTGGSYVAGANSSTVSAAVINAALDAGTTVTVETGAAGSAGTEAGFIWVNAPLLKSTASAATLNLNAASYIQVSSSIRSTAGPLNLNLNGSTNQYAQIDAGAAVELSGGTLTSQGPLNLLGSLSGASSVAVPRLEIGSTGTFSLQSTQFTLTSGPGARNYIMNGGLIVGNGSINLEPTGQNDPINPEATGQAGVLYQYGRLRPEGAAPNTPGTLTITGMVQHDSASRLEVDVAPGSSPGSVVTDVISATRGHSGSAHLAFQAMGGLDAPPPGTALPFLAGPSALSSLQWSDRQSLQPFSLQTDAATGTVSVLHLRNLWVGPGTGALDWNQPGHWSRGRVPTADDEARIADLPGRQAVGIAAPAGSVGAVRLEGDDTLQIQAGGALNVMTYLDVPGLSLAGTLDLKGSGMVRQSFEQTGGRLAGSGALTLDSPVNVWSGGSWAGGGTVSLLADTRLRITGLHASPELNPVLEGRTLRIGDQSAVEISGSVAFDKSTQNRIELAAGGTLTLAGTGKLASTSTAGASHLMLAATEYSYSAALHKTGSGLFELHDTDLDLSLPISIQAGTLALKSGTGNVTDLNVSAGAVLRVDGADLRVQDRWVTFDGEGQIDLAAGTLSQLGNGSIDMQAHLSQSGGTLSGSLSFSGPGHRWTGGAWSGAQVQGGAFGLEVTGPVEMNASSLTVGSNAWVSMSGTVRFAGNAVSSISNAGTLRFAGQGALQPADQGVPALELLNGGLNASRDALVEKTGSGVFLLDRVNFANSPGALRVSQGALQINQASSFTQQGVVQIKADATLHRPGGFVNAETALIMGTGTLDLGTGTLSNAGEVAPGGLSVDGVSSLTVSGHYLQQPTGVLTVSLLGEDHSRLVVTGTAALETGARLDIRGPAIDRPAPYALLSADTLSGQFDKVRFGTVEFAGAAGLAGAGPTSPTYVNGPAGSVTLAVDSTLGCYGRCWRPDASSTDVAQASNWWKFDTVTRTNVAATIAPGPQDTVYIGASVQTPVLSSGVSVLKGFAVLEGGQFTLQATQGTSAPSLDVQEVGYLAPGAGLSVAAGQFSTGDLFINRGTIALASGAVTLGTPLAVMSQLFPATWAQRGEGRINATGGQVFLNGAFKLADLQTGAGSRLTTPAPSAAGPLVKLGGALDLQGGTLDVSPGGSFGATGLSEFTGLVHDGTVKTSTAQALYSAGGTASQIRLDSSAPGQTLTLQGELRVRGDLTLGAGVNLVVSDYASSLRFDQGLGSGPEGSALLKLDSAAPVGSGATVRLQGGMVANGSQRSLAIGEGVLVRGFGSVGSWDMQSIWNQGSVWADQPGQNLQIVSAHLTQNGTLQASTGAELSLNAQRWTSGGLAAMQLSGGSLSLRGSFDRSDLISIGGTGPRAIISGSGRVELREADVDLQSGTLDVGPGGLFGDKGLQQVQYSQIRGGTLLRSTGTPYVLPGYGSTLRDVAFDASPAAQRTFVLSGDFDVSGDLGVARGATLEVQDGSLFLKDKGGRHHGPLLQSLKLVDIGPFTQPTDTGARVRLVNGSLRQQQDYCADYSYYSSTCVTYGGGALLSIGPGMTIEAAQGSSSLGYYPGSRGDLSWENRGTLALTGGTLSLEGVMHLNRIGTFVRTGGVLELAGMLDLQGGTLDVSGTGPLGAGGLNVLTGELRQGSVIASSMHVLQGGWNNSYPGHLKHITLDASPAAGRTFGTSGTFNVLGDLSLAAGSILSGSAQWTFNEKGGGTSQANATPVLQRVQVVQGPYSQIGESTVTWRVQGGGLLNRQGFFGNYSGYCSYYTTSCGAGSTIDIQPGITVRFEAGNTRLGAATGASDNSSGWINHGTLELTGGELTLAGGLRPADLGNFVRSGGTVVLGSAMNLAGGTVDISSAGLFGPGGLNRIGEYGALRGGTVALGQSHELTGSNSALDNVTLLPTGPGVTLTARGSFWVPGSLTLGNGLTVDSSASWTFAPVNYGNTPTTHGLLVTTGGAANFQINGGGFSSGSYSSLNLGAGLTLDINAPAGGTLTLGSGNSAAGTWTSAATIRLHAGTLALTGRFGTDVISRLGPQGNEALVRAPSTGLMLSYGTLDLAGATLDPSSGGPLGSGGLGLLNNSAIVNGTLSASQSYVLRGQSASLSNITLDSTSAARSMGAAGSFYLTGDLTLANGLLLDSTASWQAQVGSAGGIRKIGAAAGSLPTVFRLSEGGLAFTGYWGYYSPASGSFEIGTGLAMDIQGGTLSLGSGTTSWAVPGSITLGSGLLSLGGSFTTGQIAALGLNTSRTGGSVEITGTVNLANSTLDISGAGPLGPGGLTSVASTALLSNGTLLSGPGHQLVGSSARLSQITLDTAAPDRKLPVTGSWQVLDTLSLAPGLIVDSTAQWTFEAPNAQLRTAGTASASATFNLLGGRLSLGATAGTPTIGSGIGVQVQGGTLSLGAGTAVWSVLGNVGLESGELELGGNLNLPQVAGLSLPTRRTGGTVRVLGRFDLAGGTLDLSSDGVFGSGGLTSLGSVTGYSPNAAIANGTITFNPTATPTSPYVFQINGASLESVTLDAGAAVNRVLNVQGSIGVKGNLGLADGLTVNSTNASWFFSSHLGPQSLQTSPAGSARLNLLAGSSLDTMSVFSCSPCHTFTIGQGVTLSLQDGATATLGSEYNGYGLWTNRGALQLGAGGTLNLGGSFSLANLREAGGSFERTGGTLNIIGTLNLGATGTLDIAAGSAALGSGGLQRLDGSITNGRILASSPHTLVGTDSARLVNVVLDAGGPDNPGRELSAAGSFEVGGGLVLADSVLLKSTAGWALLPGVTGQDSVVRAVNDQGNRGSAVIDASGGGLFVGGYAGQLTVRPGITLNVLPPTSTHPSLYEPNGFRLGGGWYSDSAASWLNQGTINVLSGGTLRLAGQFTFQNLRAESSAGISGQFNRAADGSSTVNIAGQVDLQSLPNGVFDISSAGPLGPGGLGTLSGGTLLNGTITASMPHVLRGEYGQLENVVLDAGPGANRTLSAAGSFTLLGDLRLAAGMTLASSAQWALPLDSGEFYSLQSGGTPSFNSYNTRSIRVEPAADGTVGTATLLASGGGIWVDSYGADQWLRIAPEVTVKVQSGTFTLGAGSTSWMNEGTLRLEGGTLELAGAVQLGHLGPLGSRFVRAGGQLDIAGVLDLQSLPSATLDISSAGPLGSGGLNVLSGQLMNGRVTTSQPHILQGNGGTLSNIVLDASTTDRTLQAQGSFRVLDDLQLAQGMTLQTSGLWELGSWQQSTDTHAIRVAEPGGTATVLVTGAGTAQPAGFFINPNTSYMRSLRVDSGVHIKASGMVRLGQHGYDTYGGGGAGQGTDSPGLEPGGTRSPTLNAGTLELLPGAQLQVQSDLVNEASGQILGTGTLHLGVMSASSGSPTVFYGLNNLGLMAPGGLNGLGSLTVNGNLTLGSSGTVQLDIGGIAAGQFDRLQATQSLLAGGTLLTRVATGANVPQGTVEVMAAGTSLAGNFHSVSLPSGMTGETLLNAFRINNPIQTCLGVCWDGEAGDSLWSTAANWSQNVVPGPQDVAYISLANGSQVNITGSGLTVRAVFTGNGNLLTLASGAGLTLSDTNTTSVLSGGLQLLGALSAQGGLTVSQLSMGPNSSLSGAGALSVQSSFTRDVTAAIANGFAAISLIQDSGPLRTGALSTSGSLNLRALTGAVLVDGQLTGQTVAVRAGAGLTLASGSGVTALATAGDSIRLAAGDGPLRNESGPGVLTTQPGARWLVAGGPDPAADLIGGLPFDFKQYGFSPGSSTIAGTGNGLFYGVSPTLTVGLTGSVTKVYDGTAAATLQPGNFAVTGTYAGDTVTVSAPPQSAQFLGSGGSSGRHVGTDKAVFVAGFSTQVTSGGAPVYGYSSNTSASAHIGTITPAPLLVQAQSNSKVYDGTTGSTGTPTVSGTVYAGDAITVSQSFSSKQALGADASILVPSYTLTDGNAGANYTVSLQTAPGTVTPKPLSVTGLTAANKVYDATTTASVSTAAAQFSGLISGDTLGLSASGSFADKNVGQGKSVTVSASLTGTDAANYSLQNLGTLNASITPKTVELSGFNAASKVYDGTTSATLSGGNVLGSLAGDSVSFTGATGAFSDKNVGLGKTVTISGGTLAGADAGNYTLASATISPVTADITPRSLTLAGLSAADKVYDGTTAATLLGLASALQGVLSGDTITLDPGTASAAFSDKNAGTNKTVALSGLSLSGTDALNYTLSGAPGSLTASITPKPLSVTGLTAADKVYDATTTASVSMAAAQFSGLISGDTLGLSASGSFADKNVGQGKSVTVSVSLTGANAANYSLQNLGTLNASITPKTVELSGFTTAPKVYDGTTSATLSGGTVLGSLPGDSVSFAGASGAFSDKNVGVGKTVVISGGALSGADAGNYSLASSSTTTTTASITARGLTVAGLSVPDKVYDGTTTATLSGLAGALQGVISGDTVTLNPGSASATFSDKNVGQAKSVNLTGLSLSGTDALNYSLSGAPGSLTASITAKSISVSGITASNKVYDANTSATVSTTAAQFSGLVSGDALGVSASGSFADKNVGTGKSVTVSASLTGADALNYTLQPLGPTTASITPKTLELSGFTASNKVYDATTTATVSGGTLLGTLAGDTVTLSSSSGTFSDKNVGTNKTVTIAAGTLSGPDAGNYLLAPSAVTTTANITARGLTVAGLSVVDKVYDGSTAATLSGLAGALQGVLSGDTVTLNPGSASATFSDKNVGQAKSVNLTGLSLSGLDAGNYSLALPAALRASITPATLVVSGLSVTDKVYDGSVQARLTGVSTLKGVLGQDSVSLNLQDASAVFLDKNAGAAKPVSLSGLTLAGNDARNYLLTPPTGLAATITPRALVLTFSNPSKTYDGTTSATLSAQDDRVSGDALSLSFTAAFADRNAGTVKPLTVSSIVLSGADAANYTVPPTATTTGTITQRALATWTATSSGNWSTAANWDALPDGNNVAAVALPAGAQVTYDLSGLSLSSLSNAGNLRVSGTGLKLGALTNTGTVVVVSALDLSGLQVGGAGSVNNQGQLTLSGTALASALTNSGSVLASGTNTLTSVSNSGTFSVGAGITRVTGAFTQTSGTTTLGAPGAGPATLGAGAGASVSGGRLQGSGTVGGNLSLTDAVLSPGFSPGALNIEGNLTLGAGSTMLIELGGTDPALYDSITATGNIQLGGDLVVSSVNGFQPTAGQSFQFLSTTGSVSGSLASVSTSGANMQGLQLQSLTVNSASGTSAVPATNSTLSLPVLETQIVNSLTSSVTSSTGSTGSSASTPVSSQVVSPTVTSSTTSVLVPPPYVPPAPSPSPAPAPAPAAPPPTPTPAPAPADGEKKEETKPAEPAPAPSPAPSPASSPSPSPAPSPAPVPTAVPTATPSTPQVAAAPVVRTSTVRSLELDPAPAPSATVSRPATGEVSYAPKQQPSGKEPAKGC